MAHENDYSSKQGGDCEWPCFDQLHTHITHLRVSTKFQALEDVYLADQKMGAQNHPLVFGTSFVIKKLYNNYSI